MPTATPCTAYGFQVISGSLAPLGPRPLAWPSPPTCPMDRANGLKYDPVTGEMWVTPDMEVRHVSATGTPNHIQPNFQSTKAVDQISLSQQLRSCTGAFLHFTVSGGFAEFMVTPGNTWVLQQNQTIYVNNVAVGYTGNVDIGSAGCGGSMAGNMRIGVPCGTLAMMGDFNSNDLVKVVMTYTMRMEAWNSAGSVTSYMDWTPPYIYSATWGHG
jgi:hypothetical protein